MRTTVSSTAGSLRNGNLAACPVYMCRLNFRVTGGVLLSYYICLFYEMVSARELSDEDPNRRNAGESGHPE